MTIDEIFDLNDGPGSLHDLLNMHFVDFDEQGRVTVQVKVTQHLLNHDGIAHGGSIFTLCDTAVGSYYAIKKRKSVTLDSSIYFHAPGKLGSVLTAVVNERKIGRKVSVFLVEVHDDEKRHVADATFTMYEKP